MSANDPPNADGSQASGSQQPDPTLDWEGDKMFNIYIHDYCEKRGYTKTADALREEAGVEKDGGPPINAKQGLLFEWWSVFWVLFSAKSSGQGPEDALLYSHYQTQSAAQRQNEPQASRAPQAARPGQAPIPPRQVNGIPPRGPGQGAPPLNGMPPANAMPGQQPPMTNGMPNPYPGPMAPANGIPGTAPGAPPPNNPTMGTPAQQHMVPGQRQGMPPQRPPNGQNYRSPTMAPSPQNPGIPPGHQPNQMAGPSGPPMNRGPGHMAPPSGQPGMPGGPMAGGQQMAHPHFSTLGQQSQPNSPAAQGLPAQSPSMGNRQIRPPQESMRQLQEAAVNADLLKIESAKLPALKAELGLGDKDLPSLTLDDKQRILGLARARGFLPPLPNRPGQPPNAMPGPSNPQLQMQPNQRGPIQPPLTAQGQINRAMKRSSTSPDENGESNESSPSNKRPRKSPDQPPPMTPMIPITPQGGMPGHPHGPPSSGMMPRQGMVPFATMPMNNPSAMNMQGGPVGTPHMNNAMLSHQTLTPQMQQYRQTMQALHKSGVAQAAGPGQGQMPFNSLMPGANAASPATSSDSPYSSNPEQQPRPGPGPFGMQGMAPNRMLPGQKMAPPPSPSAAGKNMGGPQGPGGPGDKPGDGGMNQSPRHAASAPGQQGQPGQQPGPPGLQGQPGQPGQPGGPPPPGQQQQGPMNPQGGANTAPPTPGGGNAPGQGMLGQNGPPPPSQSAPPQMQPQDMFGADLMGPNFDSFGFDFQPDSFNALGELGDMSEWFNDQGLMADKL